MARWSAPSMLRTLLLSSALAVAGSAGALAQTMGGNLVIAFPANQEPASLDGHIDPYQSTWLFNSFVADPLVVLDSDGAVQAGAGHCPGRARRTARPGPSSCGPA